MRGGFSSLDQQFARFIARHSGDERPEVFLAAALLSQSTAEGNICLDLAGSAGLPVNGEGEPCPSFDVWREILAGNRAVGRPGDWRPLVLDDKGRLYLYRYWEYETKLAGFIRERAKNREEDPQPGDASLIRETLDLLFPPDPEGGADWQKLAAAICLLKRFIVISGSPGTGKTTTVTKIIALLLSLAAGRNVTVALAAPTGKAAVRLQEAVKKTRDSLPCSAAIRAAIPEAATTIHRLLGNVPHSPYFRHTRENPLSYDVVIVDEASMIDLPLLAKLAEALPAAAKLILLGDKDQLTSVEAGAVLGDICGLGPLDLFPPAFGERLAGITGLGWEGILQPGGEALNECLVQLKKSYRFGRGSGIALLSAAVNAGDAQAAVSLFATGRFDDLRFHDPRQGRLFSDLKDRVREGYRPYLQALASDDPEEVFDLFEGFRVLCALRQGPWGVEAMNGAIERLLADEGLLETGRRWYSGRPVMITRNDYQQRLFNGDVGIIMPDREAGSDLRACFRDASGSIRRFHPQRLPEHETVFAMTVHKSQGSEFDRVLMMLPDLDVPLLTRELIYTGLTRARKFVELWGGEEILRTAILRRINRASGLTDALWGAY